MPRGRRPGSNLSPSDAHEVLQALIREGRVSVADLARIREIRKLEERLASLRGDVVRGGRAVRAAGRKAGRAVRRGIRKLSPQGLASRKIQGRYLGLIRQIPASQRGKYQKIAREKNREAAIKEMQSALGK